MLELLVPNRGESAVYFLDEENLDLIKVKKNHKKCNEKCKKDKKNSLRRKENG